MSRKNEKKGNFRKTLNFVKFFLQTLKMLPSQPYRKRFNKRSNHFVQKVNFLKKKLLISKVNILFWEFSKGHLECCSKNLPKKIGQKAEKSFPNVSQGFEKKIVKMLLWTRRMQFWHARRKHFDKKPITFGSVSKNDSKSVNFAEKLFSSNWSFEHIEFSFANPAKKIITRRPKTFRLFCKKIKKTLYFSLKCCYWQKEGSFDNAAERFSTRVKVFLFTTRIKW